MNLYKWLGRREYGVGPIIGDGDFIMKRIYTSLEPYTSWNDIDPKRYSESEYGGVFNLEFSPEGNILAAACEKKAIILFDAVAQKQTQMITNAHTDNVNCIKFLDNRMFASCSDDTTVAIWDLRFLKKKLRSLQGHSNWVKNIEYSNKDGLLVTSGFDGCIFTWDINSHTEEGLIYQKVFNTAGLMRCRISPDCTKLVICTTGGFLMIIHNLDLSTLHKDLCDFRPSVYRLMQMGNQYIPQAAKFDYLFSKRQKRNRVELVSDFPDENDAEIILALQMHPHGISFLSRNISYDEQTEWSCIHDINEELYDITERRPDKRKRKLGDDFHNSLLRSVTSRRGGPRRRNRIGALDVTDQPSTSAGLTPVAPAVVRRLTDYVVMSPHTRFIADVDEDEDPIPGTSGAMPSPTNRPQFAPDIWAAEITFQQRAARQARGRQTNSVTGYDFVYAISSGILPFSPTNTDVRTAANSTNSNDPTADVTPIPYKEKYILQNAKKLMFYIQESNKGKGFIKEPSFSSDGRIICSPYDTGVRLLSYSEDCSEHPRAGMNEKLKKSPKRLVEVKTINCHSDIVLSTSFSPTQPLLVTGCKLGKVAWHYPYL